MTHHAVATAKKAPRSLGLDRQRISDGAEPTLPEGPGGGVRVPLHLPQVLGCPVLDRIGSSKGF